MFRRGLFPGEQGPEMTSLGPSNNEYSSHLFVSQRVECGGKCM